VEYLGATGAILKARLGQSFAGKAQPWSARPSWATREGLGNLPGTRRSDEGSTV